MTGNKLIPKNTFDLFSWRYLKHHDSTRPIIKKYFGESGLESLLELSENSFSLLADKEIMIPYYFELPFAANCIKEINQISPEDLLREVRWPDKYSEINRLIEDLPYRYLFTNKLQRKIFCLLLMDRKCLDKSIDNNGPRLRYYALEYVHYRNHRLFNISDNDLDRDEFAFAIYYVRCASNYMGEQKSQALRNQLLDYKKLSKNAGKICDIIDGSLSSVVPNFTNRFLYQTKPVVVDDCSADNKEICKLPIWAELSPKLNDKIVKLIVDDKISPQSLEYYLSCDNGITDFAQLYIAVRHVLINTDDDRIFYLAGTRLCQIWNHLLNDAELEEWLKFEVYKIYWRRVDGVWPIKHAKELRQSVLSCRIDYFDDQALDDILAGTAIRNATILGDSIRWLCCLDGVNSEIEEFFNDLAKCNFAYVTKNFPPFIASRAFVIKCKNDNLSPSEVASRLLDMLDKDKATALKYLASPDNTVEAKISLDAVLSDINGLDVYDRLFVLEKLALRVYRIDIDTFVIRYMVDNFDNLAKRLEYCPEFIIPIFTAACTNATSSDELSLLEQLANKCRKGEKINWISDEDKADKLAEIDAALASADRSARRFAGRRQSLVKNLRKCGE